MTTELSFRRAKKWIADLLLPAETSPSTFCSSNTISITMAGHRIGTSVNDRQDVLQQFIGQPFRTGKGDRLSTTESFLEALSAAFMEAHSLDSPMAYDLIRTHAASDFEMANASLHECAFPHTATLTDHIASVEAMRRENPEWRIAAYNYTAQVDPGSRHAIVWFTSKGTGGPTGRSTNRESVSMLFWRKRKPDGAWEAYKHMCLRGPGNTFDELESPFILPHVVQEMTSGEG